MDNGNKEKRLIIPIICFFLAFGLWFYVENLENPIRERDLSKVPVEIHNVEYLNNYELTLSPNKEYYATLKLSGPSTDLYKVKPSDFKLSVDLSEYGLAKGVKKVPIKIEESPNNITIKNTNTLTIDLTIESLIEKEIEIQSNLIVNTDHGYTASIMQLDPNIVTVSGPESQVNKVSSVIIEGEIDGLKQDTDQIFKVKAVDESGKEVTGINLSSEEIEVNIKVNKGKDVPVKINYTGTLKDGGKLKSLDLSNSTIELIGSNEVLDNINEVSTEMIDLSQYSIGDTITASIVVPNNVEIAPGDEKITINITGYKLTSKELDIEVNITGLEEGFDLEVANNTIKVKVTAYEDEIDSVTVDKITADLNIQGVSEGQHKGKPVIKTIGISENIKVEALQDVTYTVTKEQEVSNTE